MTFFGAAFLSQFESIARSARHGDEQAASLPVAVFEAAACRARR